MAEIGDILRSMLTGRTYQLERLVERFAVLGGLDPFHKVYTEIDNLRLFYERVEIESMETQLQPRDSSGCMKSLMK